jgi:hypothetical protein
VGSGRKHRISTPKASDVSASDTFTPPWWGECVRRVTERAEGAKIRNVRTLRNVAIVMLLALVVAFVPGGGNAAEAILAAITMAFLALIAWTVFVLSRQNQLTLATLSDGRRAILYGALGLIALLIAGSDELFSSGAGTLAWIFLLGASIAAIWRIWVEANTY